MSVFVFFSQFLQKCSPLRPITVWCTRLLPRVQSCQETKQRSLRWSICSTIEVAPMCVDLKIRLYVLALAVRGLDLVFSCQLQFILLFLYLLMTLTFTHCLSGSNSSGSEKWSWQQPNVYQPSPTVTEKRRRKIRYEVSIGTVGWESSTLV